VKKDIIEVDAKKRIYKITTPDERWYSFEEMNKTTGLPTYKFIPSVTWITSYVYKGIEYFKWLASLGWDEAEAQKTEAGDKGSKVHNAIEILIKGGSVKLTDKYYNNSKETDEELTPEEYGAIMSFKNWVDEAKPEFLSTELTVISKKYNYAGTVDCVCIIDKTLYIIDWKTSKNIYANMEAQLSAYRQALKEMGKKVETAKLAILQVGYKRNKKGYKFTEVDDKFQELFLPAMKFWEHANKDVQPKQVEYPMEIYLEKRKEKPAEKTNKPKEQTNDPRKK